MKRSTGHSFRFVELANDVNNHMPDYVVQRLVRALAGWDLQLRVAFVAVKHEPLANTMSLTLSPSPVPKCVRK